MKKFLAAFAIVSLYLFSISAFAFRSTSQESFTDPDYVGYKPKKVILNIENVDVDVKSAVEKTLIEEFSKRGVEATSYLTYFPPTREWSDDQVQQVLEKNNIDSVIVFSVGPYSQTVIPLGTSTTGSANTSGYANRAGGFGATTNYNSYSQNIVIPKSNSSYNAFLYDARKQKVAWQISINVKSSGALFVGQSKDAKAAARTIIKEMTLKGHLDSK